MSRRDTSRGVIFDGRFPRCHLRQWVSEVSPSTVGFRGVTFDGSLPRCHLRWYPPEVSPPLVTSRGVISRGVISRGVISRGVISRGVTSPRCHLPRCHLPEVSSPQGVISPRCHLPRCHLPKVLPPKSSNHRGSQYQFGNKIPHFTTSQQFSRLQIGSAKTCLQGFADCFPNGRRSSRITQMIQQHGR